MEEDKILARIGYKPYGSELIVYKDRLVGNRSGIAIGGFKGEILMKEIQNIEYNPGIPGISVPRIYIQHLQDGNLKKSTIVFSGIIPRLLAGVSGPKEVYQIICNLSNKKEEDSSNSVK